MAGMAYNLDWLRRVRGWIGFVLWQGVSSEAMRLRNARL
jgi:hypothetical protein